MSVLLGYTDRQILLEDSTTILYRVTGDRNPSAVLIKTLKSEYPPPEAVQRLKYECKLIENLNVAGILQPIGIQNDRYHWFVLFEDFPGICLTALLRDRDFSAREFLHIALQLATTLAHLHDRGIIHKDIKPDNILIHPQTLQVKLTNFSIASRLSGDNQIPINPSAIEGTLAYMSPEQTGRMNRAIDYRTDFYSLGVTFYQLLTEQLPHPTTDPLELIHAHLAKQPLAPHQVAISDTRLENPPQIPKTLSDIVMKLLAKTAEDRYQTALGLKADLDRCSIALTETGKIEEFTPGTVDRAAQFPNPKKLYGRDLEVSQLLQGFDRSSQGTAEIIFVSGYSGIGKTSVIQEIQQTIRRKNGYFFSGKFEQYQGEIPYFGFIQAFHNAIGHILTQNAKTIKTWKEKLLNALGENAELIIEVIPELAAIVGKVPEVPALGLTESQNRFDRVFHQFIQVFCQPEHPLVLFLDDLQWVDRASLTAIERLMSDRHSQYLLLIGAYRDNEVDATHPLVKTLETLHQTDAKVTEMTLHPLREENVTDLIADTLQSDEKAIAPLAKILWQKTEGNPFFLWRLLKSLYQDKLISFNFDRRCWEWDIETIQKSAIALSAIALTRSQIQKLSEPAQNLLKLAACLGQTFTLDTLAIARETSAIDTQQQLWEALSQGLILPVLSTQEEDTPTETSSIASSGRVGEWESGRVGEFLLSVPSSPFPQRTNDKGQRTTYQFLHDRVQQAAYSLIPDAEKSQTHLKIGRLLLDRTSESEIVESIFAIVNQLNLGINAIADPDLRDRLASLNAIAGRKAKAASAYQSALNYLRQGLSLLGSDSWQTHYQLTLDLHLEAAAAEYLNTHFDRAETLADIVIQQARSLLDCIPIYETQIQFYIAQNQLQAAIETGLQVLEALGIELPHQPSSDTIAEAVDRTQSLWEDRAIAQFADLPDLRDPYKLAAMRILMNITAPSYVVNPTLMPLIVLKMVALCIQSGNSPFAAYGYGYYAVLLCGLLGNLDAGYQFGKLSLHLLDKYKAKWLQSKLYVLFYAGVIHWQERARNALSPFQAAIQSGLETGDIEYACYSAQLYCQTLFFVGEPLEVAAEEQGNCAELSRQYKQSFQLDYVKLWRQLTLNLQGLARDRLLLIGDEFDETEILPVLQETHNEQLLCCLYLAKCFLNYAFQQFDAALENAGLALQHEVGVTSLLNIVENNFYHSLSLLACYAEVSEADRKDYLERVVENQKKMRRWMERVPENYAHKFYLVEAEKARVLGEDWQAMEEYDRAIEAAKASAYIHEEALANQRAAEFYFDRHRDKIARVYLKDARAAYQSWGAIALVEDLNQRYPQVFREVSGNRSAIAIHETTTTNRQFMSASLDLSTAFKAVQAISDEILRDRLLDKLMNAMLENAGATRGLLLLKPKDKWRVVAEGYVDRDNQILLTANFVENRSDLPLTIVHTVEKNQQIVVLNDPAKAGRFQDDPYLLAQQPQAILCLPIVYQGKLNGILYLENHWTRQAFTPDRVEVLNLLSSQAAISLENANLYEELQTYSHKLERQNAELIAANESLSAEIAERQRIEGERERLFQQLEFKRKQLEAVLEQMPAGVIIAEAPSGKLILGNEQMKQIWRHPLLPSENIDQYREWTGFYPDGRIYQPQEWPMARSILTGEVAIGEEIEILRGDGTYGTIRVSSAPIRDREGHIIAGVVTLFDITESKHTESQLRNSLKEKEVLLKEVHHRVKNNLQIISSLLNLQSSYIDDPRILEIFKDSENRVFSMSLIHEQLYQSIDLASIDLEEYIEKLVANLYASYEINAHKVQFKLDIEEILLGIDTAVPCGLIINELVLNAMKHAFPAGQSGTIEISVREHQNCDRKFCLSVRDNGIGFPEAIDFRNTDSLGLQLVMTLTEQIDGTIALNRDSGTEFNIDFQQVANEGG